MNDPIFDIFREEAKEHLGALEQGFLDLESAKATGVQRAGIDNLFRHAHSLKGDARAIGVADMQDAAQKLEDILDQLREHPEAVSRDPAVVEAYVSDPLVTVGKVPARTAYEMLSSVARYRVAAPTMRVPVLIQHGEADSLVPLEGNRAILAAIGAMDKTVITYPGLFHEIYNEPEKDAVIADLASWLEAHPRPA